MLALYTSRYMRAQASFFFHCRICLRKLSAPLPCKSLLEPVCRSTCKADLSSHLGCSRLSQCCFLTCKPLACPRSMQVYRYSSQKTTEQPKCKELQRTLHPIRAHQTQSNFEVRRCRVSVLNICGGFSFVLPLSGNQNICDLCLLRSRHVFYVADTYVSRSRHSFSRSRHIF